MKKMKSGILAGIVGVFLFSTGAMAGGLIDDIIKRKKGEIDMRFGQMESNVVAYVQTKIESFREEDRNRIDGEVDRYIDQVAPELAEAMEKALMETEYKRQTEAIATEHDKAIEELKKYVDQTVEAYEQGYKTGE